MKTLHYRMQCMSHYNIASNDQEKAINPTLDHSNHNARQGILSTGTAALVPCQLQQPDPSAKMMLTTQHEANTRTTQTTFAQIFGAQ